MDREKRRLAKLEAEAAAQRSYQPVPVERSRPSDQDEDRALAKGMDEWFALMRDHGWSDEQIAEELEWTKTVHERCFEAGLEDWQVVGDMAAYIQSGGNLDAYPGPNYWGREGANDQMPVR
jgi:hypothetical protein